MIIKNKRVITQLFLLLLLGFSLTAQPSDFPRLNQDELKPGEITQTKIYIGEELWGLINGGADLYLEYGLDRTLLQEIVHDEKHYRVEVYGMTDVATAFGIYSINKFNCVITDTLTTYICITPYQLQAAVGRYYISISNQSGDQNAEKYSLYLFEKLLNKIGAPVFGLPKYFQQAQFEQYHNQVKMIKGKLGLQNGFPRWEKYFKNFQDYEVFLLPIKHEKGFINIAEVKFHSDEDAERFLSINKSIKNIENISDKEFVLLESNLDQVYLDKILK